MGRLQRRVFLMPQQRANNAVPVLDADRSATEAIDLTIVDNIVAEKGREPGSLYRLEGDQVPKRILAKNSLHQIDFLETLMSCQVIDQLPETVILGVEPLEIDTMSIQMTPTVEAKVEALMEMVLKELDRLGVQYFYRGEMQHVSGDTCQDY